MTASTIDERTVPERSRWLPRASVPLDATTALTCYAVLLLLVPANLVLEPLGAAGSPANVFGIFLFLWWGLTWLLPGSPLPRGHQPVRIAVAVFGLAVFLSYLAFAVRAADGLERNAADRGLLLMLGWAGVTLVACDGLSSMARLADFLRRLSVLGAVVSLLGFAEYVGKFQLASVYRVPGLVENQPVGSVEGVGLIGRVAATASHPIEFGVVLAMLLPIAVHCALEAKPRQARLRWLVVVCIGIGIPLALSRSAMLATAVAVLVMLGGWSWRMRRRAAAAILGFALAMNFLVPGVLGTLRSLFTNLSTDDSIKGRTDDYSVVGRFISERPVFGRGFQTFVPSRYVLLDNQVLGLLIEVGIFGLVAFTAFVFAGIGSAVAVRRGSCDPAVRNLGQALAASIAAGALSAFTFDALGFSMFTGVLFLLVGLAGALLRLRRAGRRSGGSVAGAPSVADVNR